MDFQPPRHDSVESEALQPTEATLLEPSRPLPQPYLSSENPCCTIYVFSKYGAGSCWPPPRLSSASPSLPRLRRFRFTRLRPRSPFFPDSQCLGFKNFDENSTDYQYDVALETQAAILRSDALAMQVIQGMRLDENPKFTSSPRHRTGDLAEDASLQLDSENSTALLGRFHGGLGIQLIPNSRLVQISYTDPDPRLATEIVNTLVRTFTEQNFKTRYEAATQTSDWLNTEIDDLRLKVQTSEEKLVRYQKDHSILGVDEKQNIVTAKLDELNRELAAAEMDRIQKEATYKLSASGDPTAFKGHREGEITMMGKLRDKQAELDTQRAQLSTQFGSGYPKIAEIDNQLKQIDKEIAAENGRLRDQSRDEYLAALQRENLLISAFNSKSRRPIS